MRILFISLLLICQGCTSTSRQRDEVGALLESERLAYVQTAIMSQIGSYVNDDYLSLDVEWTARQMDHAHLTPADIRAILDNQADRLIKFGVAFLRNHAAKSEREELPPGAEEAGYGMGFGVSYAIYLNYLQHGSQRDFVKYLEAERISDAADFAEELKRIYIEMDTQ